MNKKEIVVGIDLGTTNSCIAWKDNGTVRVILIDGKPTTPSVMAYPKDSKGNYDTHPIMGAAAVNQSTMNPEATLYETKRLIGKSLAEVKLKFPYKVLETERNGTKNIAIQVPGVGIITPTEVASKILARMVAEAESHLNAKIKKAVITVPAYFNDHQRTETKEAGIAAGLEVLRIINEPTAAAIAYGMSERKSGIIVVYDMGGGTFDVSVLDIQDGVFDVRATTGDTELGGADFDRKIVEYLEEQFYKQTGIDLKKSNDLTSRHRLRDAAEKAKIELSSSFKTHISLPFIAADSTGPKHLEYDLTRAEFENMTKDLLARAEEKCKVAIKDAGIKISEISEIVMVGGMTRMKKIQSWAKDFFGKEPCTKVNPDEVVAIGACIQANVIAPNSEDTDSASDIVVLDVTPLSLGIETLGGIMSKLVTRNTTIPTQKSQIFSTAADNQPAVNIKIYQGEREMASDNKLLGQFDLMGISAAPRGVPQIEVTFDIDANGILHVSAKDKTTGKSQSLTVQSSNQISEEEVKRMREDAEKYLEEDKKRKELAEEKNACHSLMNEAESIFDQHKDHLAKEDALGINDSIAALRNALAGNEIAIIQSAKEKLNNFMPKLYDLKHKSQQESKSGSENEQKDEAENDTADSN